MQCLGGSPGHCTSQHRPAPALHMLSLENFVKSMLPSLSELKVTPSFCFAFKIPNDVAASTNYYSWSLDQVRPSKIQNLFTLTWKSSSTNVYPGCNITFCSIWHHVKEQTSQVLEPRPKALISSQLNSTLVGNSNDPPRKYCILDVIKRLINQSRLVKTGRNWSKLVETGRNWLKLVKIVKTGWNL